MWDTILCWLWPLIAGVLCAILGYLLGKSFSSKWEKKYQELKEEYKDCVKKDKKEDDKYEKEISNLKSKLNICENSSKNKFESFTSDLSSKDNRISDLEAQLASQPNSFASVLLFNATAAKAVFGKNIKKDDLKVIEGIGPKIEELFHNSGIKTWKELADASLDKCHEVLATGGDGYKIHNPGTWSEQAKLAFDGKWAELLKWQDELDGGK